MFYRCFGVFLCTTFIIRFNHNQINSTYSEVMEDEIIVEWMGEMGLMDSQAAVERLGFLPLHRQARILLLGFFHDMGAP